MNSYKLLNATDLRNDLSWDIIELDTKLDVEKLVEWYFDFIKNFNHLKFNLGMTEYLDSEKINSLKDTVYSSIPLDKQTTYDMNYYSLSWVCDKDIPIPPMSLANTSLFPEIKDPKFKEKLKIMDKFKKGYMTILYEMLKEEGLNLLRLSIHKAGSGLDKHTDGAGSIGLHIPIITNDSAYFYLGNNLEKKYILRPGSIYLLNIQLLHMTKNLGNTDRVHLYSQPTNLDTILQNL